MHVFIFFNNKSCNYSCIFLCFCFVLHHMIVSMINKDLESFPNTPLFQALIQNMKSLKFSSYGVLHCFDMYMFNHVYTWGYPYFLMEGQGIVHWMHKLVIIKMQKIQLVLKMDFHIAKMNHLIEYVSYQVEMWFGVRTRARRKMPNVPCCKIEKFFPLSCTFLNINL